MPYDTLSSGMSLELREKKGIFYGEIEMEWDHQFTPKEKKGIKVGEKAIQKNGRGNRRSSIY